jgi:hypothetical protein
VFSSDSNSLNRKALSFHGVAFGPDSSQSLRRMVQIAGEVEDTVPADPASPGATKSSYAEALDTVSFCANSHLIQILTPLIFVLYVRLT